MALADIDTLVANGPAWHDRFPNLAFAGLDPESFAPKEQVASYLVAYAQMIAAPIRTGVEVRRAEARVGAPGFTVETSAGRLIARRLVVATGAFQTPVTPALVPPATGIFQCHSFDYKNPAQLPAGAVVVVGAGSSGVQIADELNRAGKSVTLSVGPHDRPPRRYRGRDNVWWLGVLGLWDAPAGDTGRQRFTICVSGARGGATVDFRRLAGEGVTLVGSTQGYANGVLRFTDDLPANLARGDAGYLALLDAADAYVARTGLDLPAEPAAREVCPDPACVTDPLRALDLAQAGVTAIIWATGFRQDFGWLRFDTFGPDGAPRHHRGVAAVPGVYFLGLPWQTCRASSFICGVWR
ncbi:MAG: NAD(P)/FAD-dependent oxidoreductase, partial [Pseudomonadota bacterium]|nr:NAD(P)/FAD-dependent oxidoreductase [Pseudomonadota bacterium]